MTEPFTTLGVGLLTITLIVSLLLASLLAIYLKRLNEAKAPFDFSGTKPFEDKTSQAKHVKKENSGEKGSAPVLVILVVLAITAGAFVGLFMFKLCAFA